MEVNTKTAQDFVSYVEATQPMVEELATIKAAMAEAAPATVDKLIEAGFLPQEKRAQAIVAIQDPPKAMDSLQKLASALVEQRTPQPPAKLGQGQSTVKTASTGQKEKYSEADKAYLRRLGFAV